MLTEDQDVYWMRQALACANTAQAQNEVPIGAVVVINNHLVSTGHNQSVQLSDPTAHAEIIALRKAASVIQNYRLVEATLYVTLEPCLMCVGALVHARIKRLVFGAYDPKRGAVVSAGQFLQAQFHNHFIQYEGGVLLEPCQSLLTYFFEQRR